MSSQGPLSPGSAADDATAGTVAWSNPSNALTSNDTYATVAVGGGSVSHYLVLTNFGFTVPTGAAVVGIEFGIERSVAGLGIINDSAVRLVLGGVVGATDRSGGVWPATDTVATYGSSSDLWGAAPTVADVNGSGFGVALAVTSVGASRTAQVDTGTATVYYTEPGGSGVVRKLVAVGLDARPHEGGAVIRSAMPPPAAMQWGGRAFAASGIDQPPHPGGVTVRGAIPSPAAALPPGRVAVASPVETPPEPGRARSIASVGPLPPVGPPPPVARAVGEGHPAEPGRVMRGVQALVPNPPSQKPARTVTQAWVEERPPERGSAAARSNRVGGVPGQPAGRVTRATGDGPPHEPGRSVSRAGRFEWPPPTRAVRARGDDARPADGEARFARRSLAVPPARATRLVVRPGEGAPAEVGRAILAPRSPAPPPPVKAPRPAVALGWGPQPDPGRAVVLRPVGLTNRLPTRPRLATGETVPPAAGSAFARRVPAVQPDRQQIPARPLFVRPADAVPALAGEGVAWRSRVPLDVLDAGSAGHVERDRFRRVEGDEPPRVQRNRPARVGRWRG